MAFQLYLSLNWWVFSPDFWLPSTVCLADPRHAQARVAIGRVMAPRRCSKPEGKWGIHPWKKNYHWSLQITHLQRENHLPKLHDCIPCEFSRVYHVVKKMPWSCSCFMRSFIRWSSMISFIQADINRTGWNIVGLSVYPIPRFNFCDGLNLDPFFFGPESFSPSINPIWE